MSLISAKCIEFNDDRKICIATENGKTYKLNNISNLRVRKVKIDKCVAQGVGEKKCDYLMDIVGGNLQVAIFIELKGGGLQQALRQLYSTIIYLKAEFKGYRIEARIVGTRDVPGFINIPDYTKLFKELKKTGGSIQRATNKIYEEDF